MNKKFYVLEGEEKKYIDEEEISSYEESGYEIHAEETVSDAKTVKAKGDETTPVGTSKMNSNKGDKSNSESKPYEPNGGVKFGGQSKANMMANVLKRMSSMKGTELSALYDKIVSVSKSGPDVDGSLAVEEVQTEQKELPKITINDLNMSEDIGAIFSDTDLSEEFKDKATRIFEAVVVTKVNEVIESIAEENDAELEVVKQGLREEQETKLNEYLDYVVTEWVEENKLAIEQGIKTDIAESFLGGLKNLFDEHYVSIPDEKVDVVEELVAKVEELEEKLNESESKNVSLNTEIKENAKLIALADISNDLSDSETEKLEKLGESIEFVNSEDYKEKLTELKETYFKHDDDEINMKSKMVSIDEENNPIESAEDDESISTQVHDPVMRNYMNTVSRHVIKN